MCETARTGAVARYKLQSTISRSNGDDRAAFQLALIQMMNMINRTNARDALEERRSNGWWPARRFVDLGTTYESVGLRIADDAYR